MTTYNVSKKNLTSIYVAATSQHVGKTTSTLGLIHTLRKQGLNVGYSKPVGQQHVTHDGKQVDKDTALFAQFMGFEIEPDIHSPIILGRGATKAYIDNPSAFSLEDRLDYAREVLENRHEFVVYEGTGHPGVGSVANVSNSVVAEHMDSGVIMIVEAGIGNTIDLLDLNLSVFQQKNIPILGIIINKCLPEKIEQVQHYVGKVLAQRGLPILGIIPYEEELALPLMATIRKAIKGDVMYNETHFDNKVEDIIAGSLIDLNELKSFRNQLLVVSFNRIKDALGKIQHVCDQACLENSPLSGIILTGQGTLPEDTIKYIQDNEIPVIRSRIDTYESVIKISRIEVKINTRTPWKVKKAVELFEKHVDLTHLMKSISKIHSGI
ncbi:MAG: AAA family ATPase [Bacteroidota bacterium]